MNKMGINMRVFLINPPTQSGVIFMKEIGRCGRRSIAGEIWPQTGLAYLAAVLRGAGHEVGLDDAMAEGRSFDECVKRIGMFRPDLLVLHTVTPTHNSDVVFCARVKDTYPGMPVAFVGTHAAALGETVLRSSVADLAVADEGEIPLAQLADAFDRAGGVEKVDIAALAGEMPGFWVKHKDGNISFGGPGPLVEDLDSLPLPARDLLPNHRYRMPFFTGEPFATVIPSRGCPWRCSFCRSGLTWGDKVRTRSVPNVLDELEDLKDRRGTRNIVFMTDTFTYRKDWVLDLCAGMRDRKLDLRWICNSRVDTIDAERLAAMAGAGCRMVAYGVESADPKILQETGKGITPEQSVKAINLTQKAAIPAFAYFIVGLPGETWETIRKTIDFAIQLDPDHAFFHIATPFPGTELYDLAQEKGWLVTKDWDLYEEDGGGVMRTEFLSPDDLRKAQKMAIRRFYLRPSRLIREIRSVRGLRDLWIRLSAGMALLRSR